MPQRWTLCFKAVIAVTVPLSLMIWSCLFYIDISFVDRLLSWPCCCWSKGKPVAAEAVCCWRNSSRWEGKWVDWVDGMDGTNFPCASLSGKRAKRRG